MTPLRFKQSQRKARILAHIKDDKLTYTNIGKRFGISKARVQQIAKENGVGRWKLSRSKNAKIVDSIITDFGNGLSYVELKNKYGNIYYNVPFNIYSYFLEKRNAEIISQYKEKTAKRVLSSTEQKLDDPNRINGVNSVYLISGKEGYKKYPNVGDRNKGGSSEDKTIIRYIIRKRDNDGWSFKQISDKLNKLGKKTICGFKFTIANTYSKYAYYKKNRYKKK